MYIISGYCCCCCCYSYHHFQFDLVMKNWNGMGWKRMLSFSAKPKNETFLCIHYTSCWCCWFFPHQHSQKRTNLSRSTFCYMLREEARDIVQFSSLKRKTGEQMSRLLLMGQRNVFSVLVVAVEVSVRPIHLDFAHTQTSRHFCLAVSHLWCLMI